MNSITFVSITIVEPDARLAKSVLFTEGLNVISARQKDGNDRGKSVVMRSLYHALGAEGMFDSKFDCAGKIFMLEFRHNLRQWMMLRFGHAYSLFDAERRLEWKCYGSRELAVRQSETFGFKVMLPGRANNELELAPPAYSYLSSYIDQRGSKGSEFASFNNLAQYKNFKSNIFYTYAGVIDERYYKLLQRRDELNASSCKFEEGLKLRRAMIERVNGHLNGMVFSDDLESLDADLSALDDEYGRLSDTLSSLRGKLMRLRREKVDREKSIDGAVSFSRHWESGYRKLRSHKQCPLCHSVLEDELEVRVEECETREDVLFVKLEMERDLQRIESRIAKAEVEYKALLDELEPVRTELRTRDASRGKAVAVDGLVQMRDELVKERSELAENLVAAKDDLDDIGRYLKDYGEQKRAADSRLVELLKEGAHRLNLQGIDLEKLKGIQSVFKSNGSNETLATLVWYLSIQRVQREMNPARIRFPMVIDSPMSGEQDDEKKEFAYDYIISSLRDMHQVVLSGLAVEDFAHLPEGVNQITLENEKYHLLNEEDYVRCKDLLAVLLETDGAEQ